MVPSEIPSVSSSGLPALLLDPERPVSEREAALVAQLRALPDPQQRFAALVERARLRPFLPDAERIEAHRVEGCLVRIWLVSEFHDGRCWFRLDSDAVTLKALAGLLCELYSGARPLEVHDHAPRFLEELRLASQIAESRRRTVWRVRDKIRAFAESRMTTPK